MAPLADTRLVLQTRTRAADAALAWANAYTQSVAAAKIARRIIEAGGAIDTDRARRLKELRDIASVKHEEAMDTFDMLAKELARHDTEV